MFLFHVAKIETEKMLIAMVETELERRKAEGKYKGSFIGQSHFFGYEGRCGLPTNFDASYCYAWVMVLGLFSSVGRRVLYLRLVILLPLCLSGLPGELH